MNTTKNGIITPAPVQQKESAPRKVKLYSANDEPLDLSDVGSGEEAPFEESYFDTIGDWLGKHGPAISHLFLIIGSAAGTVTNSLHFSGGDKTVFTTLIFCGLIVEAAFAYSWLVQGSTRLAGRQIETAKKLYNLSSAIMIGDLSLSLLGIAIGVGELAGYWVGMVQPLAAVFLVRGFFNIKGQHPMTIEKQRVATLRARMAAGEIAGEAAELQLRLDEERHERFMKRAALEQRHGAGEALVTSGWFKRQVKKAVKESVDKKLLPNVRGKLANLPSLLQLPKSRKN